MVTIMVYHIWYIYIGSFTLANAIVYSLNKPFKLRSFQLRMETLYLIELKNNKWYVGKTKKFNARMDQHITGEGASWTRMHGPQLSCSKLGEFPDAAPYETQQTLMQMIKKGVNNVRGAEYCQLRDFTREDCQRLSYAAVHHIPGANQRDVQVALEQSLSQLSGAVNQIQNETPRHSSAITTTAKPRAAFGNSGHTSSAASPRGDRSNAITSAAQSRSSLAAPIPNAHHQQLVNLLGSNSSATTLTALPGSALGNLPTSQSTPTVATKKRSLTKQTPSSKSSKRILTGCQRCGRENHSKSSCYAKTDVDGNELSAGDSDGESEPESESTFSSGCFRCGRAGHFANSCYARSDINGNYLG